MEFLVIALFCTVLVGCIVLDISLLAALILGFCLFFSYGLIKRFSWKQLFRMALSGVKPIRNILLIFLFVGMLTALWRACGTISAIIWVSSALIRPSAFLVVVFLLNCAVSVLTGTSFGTAATMGVIAMSMTSAMEISPILTGGAILSGIFFGDRCSPVSTSALLVCELTGTDIFTNIRHMCRTALIPFLVTCMLYLIFGLTAGGSAIVPDLHAALAGTFQLSWLTFLPAILILALSFFRVNVKATMLASISAALLICLFVRRLGLTQILCLLLFGYRPDDPALSAMLSGGGILSMARVSAIVCLSSTYFGLFQGTGLLDPLRTSIAKLSRRITPFGAILVTAIVSGMIACNQTLSTMLTHQLCSDLDISSQELAIDLENSAIVIAPLIPWSIAGGVPVAAIAAPAACLSAAFFLYLLPLWTLISQSFRRRMGRA